MSHSKFLRTDSGLFSSADTFVCFPGQMDLAADPAIVAHGEACIDAQEHDWMFLLDGRLFSDVVAAEIALRQQLEARNMELESQWDELRAELEKLRAKREAAEVEASEVRRKQQEAERMVQQLSASLNSLAEKNAQLGSFWQQSAEQFTAELQRLERERKEAVKSKRALNERNKKLREKLQRRSKDWEVFANHMQHVEQQDSEADKLRQLNSLFSKRIEQLKGQVVLLKDELAKEKELRVQACTERDEVETFAQVDRWMAEVNVGKLERLQEEHSALQNRAQYLEHELQHARDEFHATRQALIAQTQSSSQSELALFTERMKGEALEEERQEALLIAARAEEAAADARREKEELQVAFRKLLKEREKDRKEMSRLAGERDYFEWQLLERRPSCVEWILPPDELIESTIEEDENGTEWHSNTLFGTENLLYESP